MKIIYFNCLLMLKVNFMKKTKTKLFFSLEKNQISLNYNSKEINLIRTSSLSKLKRLYKTKTYKNRAKTLIV